MKRLEKLKEKSVPKHIAIILDGNGRWAKRRGQPRTYGHYQGALNVKRVALLCRDLGVEVLSLYAFSTENWKRPQAEVDFLMGLPDKIKADYSQEEIQEKIHMEGVAVRFSGRRDRIGQANADLMAEIEHKTKDNDALTLNICIDYGSKDEITQAIKAIGSKIKNHQLDVKDVSDDVVADHLYTKGLPDVDLMIRTSGEKRLSNYLLWQNAYAEFYFTKAHWPAFREKAFVKAIKDYQKRHRKFGGLKGA